MDDMDKVFKAQMKIDLATRASDLVAALKMAEKNRSSFDSPACDQCGDFTNLDNSIRLYDVDEYIDFLREQIENM